MRYLLAVLFTGLVGLAGYAYVSQARKKVYPGFEQVKSRLQAQRDSGGLAPEWDGVDIDELTPEKMGGNYSQANLQRIETIEILTMFRAEFLVSVFFLSLGAAWLAGRAAARFRRVAAGRAA